MEAKTHGLWRQQGTAGDVTQEGPEEPTFRTGCAVERDGGRSGAGLEVGSWARVCAESREEMEGPEAVQRPEVPGGEKKAYCLWVFIN